MYVLDTNTLIYFFRGQGKVAERLLAIPPAEVAIPAVSVYEFGSRNCQIGPAGQTAATVR